MAESINDLWDEFNEWLEAQGLRDEEPPGLDAKPPQLGSWALVWVEDGSSGIEKAGGSWCTPERLNYIIEGCDVEEGLKENPKVVARIKDTKEPFYVLLSGVSFEMEPGDWDYGYGHPSAYITWEKETVHELTDEKQPPGLDAAAEWLGCTDEGEEIWLEL